MPVLCVLLVLDAWVVLYGRVLALGKTDGIKKTRGTRALGECSDWGDPSRTRGESETQTKQQSSLYTRSVWRWLELQTNTCVWYGRLGEAVLFHFANVWQLHNLFRFDYFRGNFHGCIAWSRRKPQVKLIAQDYGKQSISSATPPNFLYIPKLAGGIGLVLNCRHKQRIVFIFVD